MKPAFTYSIIAALVVAASGGAVIQHQRAKNESCFLGVKGHLAMFGVGGVDAKKVCDGLIAKHPDYWEYYVAPRVTREYETQQSHVTSLCHASWPPRVYVVFDVNYGAGFIGSYGSRLCASLEDHDPASRL